MKGRILECLLVDFWLVGGGFWLVDGSDFWLISSTDF